MDPHAIESFRKSVYDYYTEHKRSFPWRDDTNAYSVFISEVMLQQTQAGSRTIEKYREFMNAFPSFEALASASLRELLRVWSGLGYNRRARLLQEAARIVVEKHNGMLPRTIDELDALPGIGYATACSISAFAFNVPVVFIETNIRSVFIHHFFPGRNEVHDNELLPLIETSLDKNNPREWYSALMDYGSMLKKVVGNESRRSKHYTRQSTFEGSDRQLRGAILRLLTDEACAFSRLSSRLQRPEEDVSRVVEGLIKDKLIVREGVDVRIV